MDVEVEQLAELMQKVADLLFEHNENNWGQWFALDVLRIKNQDYYGVEHVLAAFGGAGSINDLVLHPLSDRYTEIDMDDLNNQLANWLREVFTLASKLRRAEAGKN